MQLTDDRLAEVLRDMIQLPMVAADHIRCGRRHIPRHPGRARARQPYIMVNTAVAEHLEVLCVARGRRLGIVERVDHAYSVDRLLRDGINHNPH